MSEQINALVEQHKPRVVALDLSRVPDIEYSAGQTLAESEQRWKDRGIEVWLAGLNPGVLELARHVGLHQRLGRDRLLFDARAAIRRYQELQAADATRAPSTSCGRC